MKVNPQYQDSSSPAHRESPAAPRSYRSDGAILIRQTAIPAFNRGFDRQSVVANRRNLAASIVFKVISKRIFSSCSCSTPFRGQSTCYGKRIFPDIMDIVAQRQGPTQLIMFKRFIINGHKPVPKVNPVNCYSRMHRLQCWSAYPENSEHPLSYYWQTHWFQSLTTGPFPAQVASIGCHPQRRTHQYWSFDPTTSAFQSIYSRKGILFNRVQLGPTGQTGQLVIGKADVPTFKMLSGRFRVPLADYRQTSAAQSPSFIIRRHIRNWLSQKRSPVRRLAGVKWPS